MSQTTNSLTDYLENEANCVDLRRKAALFLVEVKANIITTFACPVCGEDLRRTYQQGLTPYRGNCVCCKLGIQMNHDLVHEGHEGCAVRVRFPVSLCDPQLTKELRQAWVKKHGTVLVSKKDEEDKVDLDDWVKVAQDIAAGYNARRKPN